MDRRSRMLMWACTLVMTPVAGCNGQLTPQAKELLTRATASLSRGDYAATVTDMDRFLREHGSSRQVGRAYYLRGKARLGLKDLAGACGDLAESLDHSKDADVRVNAMLALGDLAFDAGDLAVAQEMYSGAISQSRAGKAPRDHAHYRLGCVYQRLGKWHEADRQFHQVVEYFGGTELARRAGRRVNAVAWTVQVGAFSSKGRADALAGRLRDREQAADVIPIISAGQALFIVVVGCYDTQHEADEALGRIKRFQAGAYVTVRTMR